MKTLTKDALLVAPRQELIEQILQQQARVEELEFRLEWLQRQIFGAKSERFVPGDDLQTMLDLGIVAPQQPQPDQVQDVSYQRRVSTTADKPQVHGRGPMPTHLPIDEVTIQPEGDLAGFVRLGDDISWHYEMLAASLRVIKVIRPRYARPNGEGVVIGKLPPLPIDKGNAGPGLMAQVTIDKYVYHMPLDRQRKKFKNEYDVEFSESWLCDIVKNTAFWLTPIYQAYVESLLKASYLQADETPIPVLMKDRRGKTHRGYFWVYHDPLSRNVIFDYQQSRSANGPKEFLKNFKGILQVDGYDGYNQVVARSGVIRAGCMDHVRRRFEKALDFDKSRAEYALNAMRPWYELETQARMDGLSLAQRFSGRVATTVPAMRAFGLWLKAQLPLVLPKSPMGNAISYALNQWPHFGPFMTDSRVELSNILIENAIRPVAIGRKNYMFCGSHDAAERAAMVYSLVASAKLYGVDPLGYFKELLTKLPASTNQQIEQFLLPQWKPAPTI